LRNIKLVIEYDGTRYNGWQSQKNGKGIQEMITNALHQVTGEEIKLNGSGRTDAGVHAFGQGVPLQRGVLPVFVPFAHLLLPG